MMAPKSRQEAPAIAARGSVVELRARPPSRPRRRAPASSVIRIDCALASCSAWASRSAAIQSGLAGLVGEDQHLGRAGDHVDADLAEHQPLGRRDIGVAGPDDLGDRRDRRGAVGERRHRLRAADAIDLVDAGELRRRQHQRVELAVRAPAPP